ncbi:MAG: endolytic transglycosylase MltG [Candidatus Falkowbacteria bacterium]|nr:endolytic transglycosylase MltG [Candidatus Falkowbacteria bacterium]
MIIVRKIPQMRSNLKFQGRTIYQAVIMASIIEKEAPFNPNDKDNRDARIISGIFWNRLKINQALQSDATLSYFLDDKKPQHSGQELATDSPYNTYKYPGLPPTPICNPGLLALEAAIYPIETDYNYFLTPTGSRQVIFAKTYEEHLANKAKYLK